MQFVLSGWPLVVQEEMLKPYMERQLELSTKQGCLMWGIRVVIPPTLQDKVLEELHGGHIGVIKMKALAWSHVWWPGIDNEIEGMTSRCKGCRAMRQDPKLTLVRPWEFPEGPWGHVHFDFAQPLEGKQLLIVVDAFSKWPRLP